MLVVAVQKMQMNLLPSKILDSVKVELGMEVGCLLHAEKKMTEWETEAVIFKGGVQSPDWLAADWLEEPASQAVTT